MEKAIIGKKVGMTQIFDEAGHVIPVTVIEEMCIRDRLHLRRGCRRGPRRLPGCLGRAVCPALPRRQQKGR